MKLLIFALVFLTFHFANAAYVVPNNSVSTAKIQDNAVTKPKLAALGMVSGTQTTGYSNSTSSVTDVPGLSVSLTTTGRPVFIGLTTKDNNQGAIIAETLSTNSVLTAIFLLRDASSFARQNFGITATATTGNLRNYAPCSSIFTLDFPASGTHTYSVQATGNSTGGSTGTIYLQNCSIYAYEL